MPLVQIAVVRNATLEEINEGKPDCEVLVAPQWRVIEDDSRIAMRIFKEFDLDIDDKRIEVLYSAPFHAALGQ